MRILLYLFLIIISSIGISKSATFVVKTITRLAKRLRISDFTLGFFVLGIATSTPELFVGINSALDGVPQLSMGNLIGGIIVLLLLVIGGTAVLSRGLSFKSAFSPKELLLSSFLIISPVFLILDGRVSRFDGLLLLTLYLVFFFVMNRQETILEHVRDELTKEPLNIAGMLFNLFIGFAGLLLFSKVLVEMGIIFAELLNIPALVIGLLILSIGTNLPELSVGIFSSRNLHKQLALGNYLGSAAANIPVLGIVALIHPIEIVNPVRVGISAGLLVVTVVIFSLFARSQRTISRFEGSILLFAYLLFVLLELITNSH